MDRSSVSAGVSPPTTRTRTAQMPDGLCGRTEGKRSNAARGSVPSSARTSGSESPSWYVRLKSMLAASRSDALSLAMASAESMISRGEGRFLGYLVSPQLLRWPNSADGATRAARSARRAVVICSALGKLVDHEAPNPPAAGLPAPDGHVAAGAVDRRAGLRGLDLLVRPDVHRVIAGDEELGALQRERGDAVLRHLVDEERVDGRAVQIGRAREEEPHVAGELAQRHRRVALEPRLAIALERSVHRLAVDGGVCQCRAATRGDKHERADHADAERLHLVPVETVVDRNLDEHAHRAAMDPPGTKQRAQHVLASGQIESGVGARED